MRVIMATDGSEDARNATGWFATFPLPATTEILALAVAELPATPVPIPIARELDEIVRDAVGRAATDACETLRRRWPNTTVRIVDGDPRERIPEIADEWDAGLIVVGARGLGAVRRFLLGSVSSAVAHDAPCPVLVVKPGARACRRIVIAVDGSPDSLAAARFVGALALEPSTTIRLLGVVPRPYAPRAAPAAAMPFVHAALEDIVAEQDHAMRLTLGAVGRPFEGRAGAVERMVPVGVPADEIVLATEGGAADLVVVGARGLGGVKRLVLGSVSERVLHHAACPVLIVKGTR